MHNIRSNYKIEHFIFLVVSTTLVYLLSHLYDLSHMILDYGAYISCIAIVVVVFYEFLRDRNRIKQRQEYLYKFFILLILSFFLGTLFYISSSKMPLIIFSTIGIILIIRYLVQFYKA